MTVGGHAHGSHNYSRTTHKAVARRRDMLVRRRGLQVAAGVAVLALAATACGGSKGKSTATNSPTGSAGSASGVASSPATTDGLAPQNLNNTGTPVKGGTLHMLGVGDVDYMDPNLSYYSGGYLGLRLWSRQLLTYPAIAGKATTAAPDLAQIPTTANGGISADGLTYKYTIVTGAKWNTTPARQVNAADVVRGVKRTCNPAQPFGGLPDYQSLISGFDAFCTGFAKVDPKSATAIADYQNKTALDGVTVDPSNPLTVVFKLTRPASYFISMSTLPAFSPSPVEYDKYIPASAELAANTISDGPYMVTKYTATKEILFDRNPAWDAATDPIRKAYVDKVVVNETGDQTAIQQQLQANTAGADMEWDTFPPVSQVSALKAAKDPNFYLGPTFSSNPYVIFNTVSPNNGGALTKVAVRKALSEAISRANLIQDANGPDVSPPLTHILPAGISGTTSNTTPDIYKYDVAQAKKDLAAAGVTSLTLKFLYRPKSSLSTKIFTTMQQDLGAAGIKIEGVGVPNADFYTKYLQVPDVAKKGTWDVSLAGWGPDWYGNAALSFFAPLFSGAPSFPPIGSNFGLYENAATNALIDQASKEQDETKANALWAKADAQVMDDAAIFPITADNQAVYHAKHVHNTVFIPAFQQIDPANVWLTSS
jgi:peptide/nickel transport system substrate-binding protein